jgi:hypothetical protein
MAAEKSFLFRLLENAELINLSSEMDSAIDGA